MIDLDIISAKKDFEQPQSISREVDDQEMKPF